MSTFEVKMPKLGESITEGTIIRWTVKVGDTVKEDDILFEVGTAKVSAEIPSPVDGKVSEIRFNADDVVPVGTVMAIIETEDGTTNPAATDTVSVSKPLSDEASDLPKQTSEIPETSNTSGKRGDRGQLYTPLVRSIAQAEKISDAELEAIKGSGYQGRVNKADVMQYLEQRKKETPFDSTSKPAIKTSSEKAESVSSQGDTVVEMDRMRRIIADHMVMSKNVSPHVTTVVEADVTQLVRWRERTKNEFYRRSGVKLTYMPVIVEACAKALIDFPRVNASVDGYNIILKQHINVGIAVALDDGNLIVPVVHDADKLNIGGLATAIDTLAAKARGNKLSLDDIQAGTFSITNFGTFKNILGTPIINQPQVAILGVGYVEKKPAVVETPEGDMIAIRHKMFLSLSYDHRIVDGALGGAFLRRVADYLEEDRK